MLFEQSLALLHDIARFVSSAHFANVMGQFQFAAMVAFHHARDFQFEMGPALVFALFGRFREWYCHVPTSLQECSVILKVIV
jgi:hypothetical protein